MQAHLLGKPSQPLILVGYGHALQITVISDCLEVPANKEEVDLVAVLLLEASNFAINRAELAMTATFHGNFHGGEVGGTTTSKTARTVGVETRNVHSRDLASR